MRARGWWVTMAVVLIALAGASLGVGAARLQAGDAMSALVLSVSRIPRTLAAVLTGAALAVAGVVMQEIVRNRFVEPATAGSPEAAAAGLLAVTLIAPHAPLWVKMVVAAASALAGAALFVVLIRRLPPHEIFLVPLAGLVLSGVVGAGVTFIAWQADLMQYVSIWMLSGEFSGVIAGRYELLWIGGAAAALAWVAADRFAILGLGPDAATALGLSPRAVIRFGLLVVALVTAMVVVSVGMIPFVGLIVPNLVSRMMGDNLRASLPVVALSGAILVLASDLVGRLIIYPYEVPAGIILGVFGAAAFLGLLWRGDRHVH
ncbi:MAG: iron chelate uptake ABC transporter family permease subunit [Thioclava marina]|nr:iron chelate uptake ABC transporter family permease subunit [Thioclava marina]